MTLCLMLFALVFIFNSVSAARDGLSSEPRSPTAQAPMAVLRGRGDEENAAVSSGSGAAVASRPSLKRTHVSADTRPNYMQMTHSASFKKARLDTAAARQGMHLQLHVLPIEPATAAPGAAPTPPHSSDDLCMLTLPVQPLVLLTFTCLSLLCSDNKTTLHSNGTCKLCSKNFGQL